MTLHIAICDDEPEAIDALQKQLESLSFDLDLTFSIDTFTSGKDLLSTISASDEFPYQLLFLDIEISDENGIEISRSLYRSMPTESYLIFVSSYPKYMQDSFSVHPFSYLTKPVLKVDIQNVLNDILERYKKDRVHMMVVTNDGRDISVPVKNITYIQGTDTRKREITIHVNSEEFICRGSISDIEHDFSDILFRLNRTTLVNLLNIHYIKDDKVVMHTGDMLQVSVRAKRQLIHLLQSNPAFTR